MKKYMTILFALLLAVSLTACAEKTAAENETIAENTENEENTMVMITDDTEFGEKLGMTVDTSKVPVMGMARYIVDGEIAYFCFGMEETGKAPVSVLLRATANKELKDSLSEFDGEDIPSENAEICGLNVVRKDIAADDTVYHQYEFEKDGIYYCLAIVGDISDELFETLFASFLEAVRPA